MAKQTLTLVRGLPGSGKSTYAKTLNAVLVEADQFFIDSNDTYQFDPALIKNLMPGVNSKRSAYFVQDLMSWLQTHS